MAGLLSAVTSARGKAAIRDRNRYLYTANGCGAATLRWRCSNRTCSATLSTRKSTGNLVGETLPEHSHGNKLFRQIVKETEATVIQKYAEVHGAILYAVLQEISVNMLTSDCPGQIGSASS